MNNLLTEAFLISPTEISIANLSNSTHKVSLIKEQIEIIELNKVNNLFVADHPIELGFSYFVQIDDKRIPLNVSKATEFPSFDNDYFYDKSDLGYIYSKESTSFTIWAPLSSKVVLKIKRSVDENYSFIPLERHDKGVFKIVLKGDYENALYTYLVTNNEITNEVTDPYGRGSTLNSKQSVVIDFGQFVSNLNNDKLPKISSLLDAIVYETHVRDMTISPFTNIENKGKFLGLAEEGKTTLDGYPAGLDYISQLGITHLQLLPVCDYLTVNEEDPLSNYNWGYDPGQYFVLEGSYGSTSDPTSRIKDFKTLVSTYHKHGIRIVMDMVFNHVYKYEESVFEKIVPNYYFRKNNEGKLSNNSGCGNDLATEKPMVQKFILDVCEFYVKEFKIDGFRFDLMGLLDIELISKIWGICRRFCPDFVIYGEGWNMGNNCPKQLANIGNSTLIPFCGFFNDQFRETYKNFFLGKSEYVDKFMPSFFGNSLKFFDRELMFDNHMQSINYCECHDNETLFDVIKLNNFDDETTLEILSAINSSILLSFGTPFFHMGQELGQTKYNERNTYNKGDYYNQFQYDLIPNRLSQLKVFKEAVSLRKKLNFNKLINESELAQENKITRIGNTIQVTHISDVKCYQLFFNPTGSDVIINLDEFSKMLFSSSLCTKLEGNCVKISPRSVVALSK